MDTTTMTIRVDAELKQRLEKIAKSERRSKSFLAAEAVTNYVEMHERQIAMIEEGLAQLDRGEHISHEEVGDRIAKWKEGTLLAKAG